MYVYINIYTSGVVIEDVCDGAEACILYSLLRLQHERTALSLKCLVVVAAAQDIMCLWHW